MADDKTLTENDDDIEVVEVAELPKPDDAPKVDGKKEAEDQDEDSSEDEDAHLAGDDEDDDEADATDAGSPNHRRRVGRRKKRNMARDRTLAEMAQLREQNAEFARQLAEIQRTQVTHTASQIDERLSKTRDEIALADRILAKAIEAGNGEDAAAALRLRDEAKASELELLRSKDTVSKTRESAPDPEIVRLSREWKGANATWYGVDQSATQVANQIDAQVASEGYDPAKPAYWQELSRRLQARFQPNDSTSVSPPKKKAPPQGATREHVPSSTRKEVYVTPERKQAMIDSGMWDDPVRRAKMLKAYAQYDREQSAS